MVRPKGGHRPMPRPPSRLKYTTGGVAIACRPSATLVDQDHVRWNCSTSSPKAIHLLPEEHGEIWGD